jgi:ABC-2 type transport system ATP-binding protein
MNEPIVIENLTKYYNNFLALDNISLRIEGNENVGFLGPNGAGKSTTLKILCGLIRTTSGKAYIKGFDIASQKEKALSQIGTIIETPEFYGFLTPKETLNYFGRLRGMSCNNLNKRITEVINLVSLEQWLNVKIEKFSRGMKQRLALAQALLHDPPILILDEPALGLDPRAVMEFRRIIVEAGKDKVVFFASHQLSEVAQICKHVAVIDHGRLLGYDSIEALEQKYGSLENAYLQLTGVPIE